ncbi:MAG: SRPBCC family protein [Chloroflexota bacterium]
MTLDNAPVVKTQMLIRRPVAEVFAAFADPAITTRFWFTRSSGRLEPGTTVRWEWEMYGVSADVEVKVVEPNRRIVIEWQDMHGHMCPVEWTFTPYGEDGTIVVIANWGFTGSDDEIVAQAIDSMGGFTFVLAGLKALLEHNVSLNLVADHHPEANVK